MSVVSAPGTWRRKLPRPSWPQGWPRVQRVAREAEPDDRTVVLSYAMSLLSALVLVLLVNLTLVSQLQHYAAQHRLYDELRLSLAEGSVPIGQLDANGHLVAPGTPIALLQIPELGVKEVVVEGSTSEETKLGVGHRRDTPFPGQAGVSVLIGRKAAYGGVFGHLDRLTRGQTFTVTTGQGVSTYRVIGARGPGTRLPTLAAGSGRLTLVTATGHPFMPSGVLRVDADLISKAFPRPPVAIGPGAIADDEQALKGDHGGLSALAWLLELLVVLGVAAVWAWKRWDVLATWVVFTPLLAVTALAAADRVCDLLPNLL
jgi:LPXTG-site transpeptidase (sortase) family protein